MLKRASGAGLRIWNRHISHVLPALYRAATAINCVSAYALALTAGDCINRVLRYGHATGAAPGYLTALHSNVAAIAMRKYSGRKNPRHDQNSNSVCNVKR